jgi:AcrR family transcriptional regulator
MSVKGYAGTRLSDVAEYAEVQAPAIYYYFASREDLIEEVMYAGIADMTKHLRQVLDALPPDTLAIDRILAAVEAHLRHELEISNFRHRLDSQFGTGSRPTPRSATGGKCPLRTDLAAPDGQSGPRWSAAQRP